MQKWAQRALVSAKEHDFALVLAAATILEGVALVGQDRADEGSKRIRDGIDAYRATGAAFQNTHHLVLLAEALGAAGSPEDGLEALAEAEGSDERYCQAEIHRLRGLLLLAQSANDWTVAETSFRQALDVACGQEALTLELRAATSLARLWRDQGKSREARELLAPVHNRFREGFDTADLKDAKALLDELG